MDCAWDMIIVGYREGWGEGRVEGLKGRGAIHFPGDTSAAPCYGEWVHVFRPSRVSSMPLRVEWGNYDGGG